MQKWYMQPINCCVVSVTIYYQTIINGVCITLICSSVTNLIVKTVEENSDVRVI